MDWYADVFEVLFAGLDQKAASSLWKSALKKKGKRKEEREEDSDDD